MYIEVEFKDIWARLDRIEAELKLLSQQAKAKPPPPQPDQNKAFQ